ncbi:MAG: Cystine-binding periplasmic protein precursor [uncultured Paraburkholderia sp.]|nr:MAG: Cystine-binding periplasmic protein precursor [uncultured Paraburkholderia sp.]
MLKKLFVAALIGASFTAVTAHADDLLDQVKQRGTLRVGLEGTFPRSIRKRRRANWSATTSTSPKPSRPNWA